jgi:hypothetical protein
MFVVEISVSQLIYIIEREREREEREKNYVSLESLEVHGLGMIACLGS